MGTAFVSFYREPREAQSHRLEKNITIEIGKVVFRAIIEEMEHENSDNADWKGNLDAAYGIKYLYVGAHVGSAKFDFGPAFCRALERLIEKGPPAFYPKQDDFMFNEQIDSLMRQYLELRPQ